MSSDASGILSRTQAKNAAWRRGYLKWKLNSCQKAIYDLYNGTEYKKMVVNIHRRGGKSRTLLIIALEKAIKNPGSQIKFAAPTIKAASKIIRPILTEILTDCPKELKPKYSRQEGVWKFPNGSMLFIEGMDGQNAENLRGTAMDLGIVDEAAFTDQLSYIVNDILLPQTATTRGRIIIASTPPKSPGHDFITYIEEAELNGTYIKKTIEDYLHECRNDPPELQHIPFDEIEVLKKASGGAESTTWKREYLCNLTIDENQAIIPEFSDTVEREVVLNWQRPTRYDAYTSLDFGVRDYTACLFAYYDFKHAKLVIEDEFILKGSEVTTLNIATYVKNKEESLWVQPMTLEVQPPYIRICDNDLRAIADLDKLHGLTFVATRKDKKEMAVNEVRMKMGARDIIINPRCVKLISQLKRGIWDKNRSEFARSIDNGHYDLIDCLVYMVRNVLWSKNPYPAKYGDDSENTFYPTHDRIKLNKTQEAIKSIFIKPSTKKGVSYNPFLNPKKTKS